MLSFALLMLEGDHQTLILLVHLPIRCDVKVVPLILRDIPFQVTEYNVKVAVCPMRVLGGGDVLLEYVAQGPFVFHHGIGVHFQLTRDE